MGSGSGLPLPPPPRHQVGVSADAVGYLWGFCQFISQAQQSFIDTDEARKRLAKFVLSRFRAMLRLQPSAATPIT